MQQDTAAVLAAGFLLPGARLSPLSPVRALVIQGDSADVRLTWEAVPGARSYHIHRGTTLDFVPEPVSLLGTTADTSFVDAGIVPTAGVRYYYIVISSSSVAARGLALWSSVMHGESGEATKKGAIARASKHDGGK
jgi:hypothetical protein